MDYNELKKRIDNISYTHISVMEANSIKMLTGNFQESLVRRLLAQCPKHYQKAILRVIEEDYKMTMGYNRIPAYFQSILFDIDCGIFITADDEEVGVPQEERERGQSVEEKANRVSQPDIIGYQATIDDLKAEIDDLKAEIESMREQNKCISSKQAAILTLTACYHVGGLPQNRQNLYPILTNLFGVADSLAQRRLREGIKEKDAAKLASYFEGVAPKIARIIREMPEMLKRDK